MYAIEINNVAVIICQFLLGIGVIFWSNSFHRYGSLYYYIDFLFGLLYFTWIFVSIKINLKLE